nr:degenerin-like protein asic-2; partial [Biomphalaria glabrata]
MLSVLNREKFDQPMNHTQGTSTISEDTEHQAVWENKPQTIPIDYDLDLEIFNESLEYDSTRTEPVDEDALKYERQRLDKNTRIKAGHQLRDMVLFCSVWQKFCSPRHFRLFTTYDLGNCYTLDTTELLQDIQGVYGESDLTEVPVHQYTIYRHIW